MNNETYEQISKGYGIITKAVDDLDVTSADNPYRESILVSEYLMRVANHCIKMSQILSLDALELEGDDE